MSEIHREMAEFAADLRAWLDEYQAGAFVGLPRGQTVPPLEVEVQAEPPAWSDMASSARDEARDRARFGKGGLESVRADLGNCQRCPLASQRTQIVFGVGNPNADLVIVGEAPGYHEDQQGEPFVGEAGQMLDKMLLHVLGLSRDDVYILNVVKCRPPRNRNPLPNEVEECLPFLERQLRAIRPKMILVLGSVALKSLFSTSAGITRQRGVWMEREGIPVLPTFHPAYLLRNPAGKRDTFNDLKALRQRYDQIGGYRP